MSNEQSRRSSTIAFAPGDSVPRAPPLPAPRPLRRARDAATRLFGYGSRPPSPEEDGRMPYGGVARFASLSATQNASTSHKTGLEINTISINEAGTHALLGGKEIFKTVKVEEGHCAEEFNLRSAIRSTPTQASGKARQIYSINIADVAWAKGDCGDYVAAATSSGKIILYDLGHAGLQAAQLHEHFRQVHKVTFNPHRGNLLLSGSQDGTVRLWDVRDVRHASTLKSKHKYSGQADGIRDVKWSPTEGVDFAFGTDSGWIQRWDMRNLKTAKVKISAHSVTVTSLDWHPDGRHIASASADKTVRVWDFSTTRRQKHTAEIRAPHPVLNARWRPSCESPLSHESGARQCTQLVTAYDASHSALHVWDLRRPALPFRELWPYHTAPTDLLWHSQDLLWTVGREGVFLQTDIQYATKSISKRNLQAVTASPRGELSFVSQKRRRQRSSGHHGPPLLQHKSSSLGRSPEPSALSRSWADDGLDQSFLSVPQATRRRASLRSQSLSINDSNSQDSTAYLSDVLATRHSTRPLQAACRGALTSRVSLLAFEYLAEHLTFDLRPVLTSRDDFLVAFEYLMESNVKCCEALAMHRLAQSWNIVNLIFKEQLQERGRLKQQRLLEQNKTGDWQEPQSSYRHIANKLLFEQMQPPALSNSAHKPVSSIAQQLAVSDSASNQQTPQAQPQREVRAAVHLGVTTVPDPDNIDQLNLPPLVVPEQQRLYSRISQQASIDPRLTRRNLDGLQEQQQANGINRSDMVRRWSIQPKEPLSLDLVDSNGVWIPPKLQKHDSNESFAFLAESSDSRGPSFPSSFNSNESTSGRHRMVAERPSRTDLKKDPAVSGVDTLDFGTSTNSLEAQSTSGDQHIVQNSPAIDGVDANGMNHQRPQIPRASPIQHIGPGSYPDENGISPLIEERAPKSLPRNANAHNDMKSLALRSVKKEPGLRDSSVSRLSVKNTIAEEWKNSKSLFLPEDYDADAELGKPFLLKDVVREMASNHAQKGNAQTSAAVFLLLAPLLPRTHHLPDSETEATVSTYVDCLGAAGFAREDIQTVLDDYLKALVSSGLQPLQIEAVVESYHDQLLRHGLLNQAAALRNLSYVKSIDGSVLGDMIKQESMIRGSRTFPPHSEV